MSCYVVSDKTINAIVWAMRKTRYLATLKGFSAITDPDKIGQILVNQNYKSVNSRYNEGETPHNFKYDYIDGLTLGDAYGCINCYMYQACETPDWVGSEIYFTLCNLKDKIAEAMAAELGQAMPWGLN